MNFLCLFIFMLIVPLSTEHDNLLLTHNGETLASINRDAFTSPLIGEPVLDEGTFEQFLLKLNEQLYEEPINAKLNERGEIVPGVDGHHLDRRAFTKEFFTYLYGRGPARIEVPTHPLHPKVDSELLSDIRTKYIGGYITYYNRRNQERSNNIILATEALNNHVVFPGEIFSFNKVVGERTSEKGYLPAPVIVKGEVYEGVGGGICQVSSTLFNAVDRAGIQIVQRYSHSRRVPYVPPGRDATVSWYGPDFTFKNNYNQPILIRAKAHEGKVYTAIFSSDAINNEPNF